MSQAEFFRVFSHTRFASPDEWRLELELDLRKAPCSKSEAGVEWWDNRSLT